jgi:quinoprotein glucose dehydrogenase
MKRSVFLALANVLAAAVLLATMAVGQTRTGDRPVMGKLPPAPQEVYYADPPGVTAETFLDGLDVVWGLQFAPDGRLFLTEKPGRVRVVSRDGVIDPTPWLTVADVNARTRERGLLGIALHPQFPEQPWVYVMYTADTDGDGEVVNRVSRFREVAGRGTEE